MGKKKTPKPQLTGLQESFCQHFVANRKNGTRAAESAGYAGNENTWAVQAHANLRNHKIKARIKELQKEQLERLHLDSDAVLLMAYENREFALEGDPVIDKEGDIVGYKRNVAAANQATKMIGDHKSIQAFVKEDGDDKSKDPIGEININVIGLDRALT
jgi:phage terminase small subunit